jgi:hypothetical protein
LVQAPSEKTPIESSEATRAAHDRRVYRYALVVLVSAPLCYALFLKVSSLTTNVWYYLPVLSLLAMSSDAILGTAIKTRRGHAARGALTVAACTFLFYPSLQQARFRQTNADLVGGALTREARAGDFIIVSPWYFGQCFERCYHGNVEWMTIPPLAADHRVHYDNLFAKRVGEHEPLRPIFLRAERALKSGHSVWFVGKPALTDEPPPAPPPSRSIRQSTIYTSAWALQTGYFLYRHGVKFAGLAEPLTQQPVSPFERLDIAVVSGWSSTHRPPHS